MMAKAIAPEVSVNRHRLDGSGVPRFFVQLLLGPEAQWLHVNIAERCTTHSSRRRFRACHDRLARKRSLLTVVLGSRAACRPTLINSLSTITTYRKQSLYTLEISHATPGCCAIYGQLSTFDCMRKTFGYCPGYFCGEDSHLRMAWEGHHLRHASGINPRHTLSPYFSPACPLSIGGLVSDREYSLAFRRKASVNGAYRLTDGTWRANRT
jgi:hypothetical protein